jgi:hypothetical protein
VDEGLRNRRNAYLAGLGFCALAILLAALTAPTAKEAADRDPPTVLTAIFLFYGLGSIAVWYSVFLRPERAIEMADRQSPSASMGKMSWLLSLMGIAAMVGPVVMGVLLYQISGDVWRLALLGGVGLVGGLITYLRVGECLRALGEHGLVAWDPFGPPMD